MQRHIKKSSPDKDRNLYSLSLHTDLNGTILSTSGKLPSLIGKTVAELKGSSIDKIITLSDSRELSSLIKADRLHHLQNIPAKLKGNGEIVPVLLSVLGGNNGISHLTWHLKETHTNKSIKKLSEASITLLSRLFENHPQPVLVCFPEDLCIVFVNKECTDLYGYTAEELLDQSIYKVASEETAELITQTSPSAVNTLHFPKSGGPVGVSVSATEFELEQQRYAILYISTAGSNKLVEEKLQEKTEELNMVVSSLDDVVFELDKDFIYQKVWCRDERLLFMMPAGFLGKTVSDVFQREINLKKALVNDFEYVSKTKSLTYRDYSLTIGDELKWYNAKISPLFDKAGALKGFTKRITDITERKKVELAVEEKNNQLRLAHQELSDIIRTATEIIIKIDKDGVLLFVSPEFERCLGYKQEEVIGKTFQKFIHRDDFAFCAEAFNASLQSRKLLHNVVYRVRKKDGCYLWFSTSGTFIFDDRGELLYGLGFAQDITELKLANESLRHQARVLENVSDAIIVTDLNLKIVTWNEAAERIYNCAQQEAIGKTISEIVTYNYFNCSRVAAMKNLMENDHWTGEAYFDRSDGKRIYILSSVSFVKNEKGERINIAAVNRDITDRVKSEQALRISEERYRSLVDALGEGILLRSKTGEIIACNKSAENILGVKAADIVGTIAGLSGWNILHEDGSLFPIEDFPSVLTLKTGQSFQNIVIGLAKANEKLLWLSVNTEPIFYSDQRNTPDAVVASFVDITQKKNAEGELLRREKQLREYSERISSILDSITDGFIALDRNLQVSAWNHVFEKGTGIKASEVLGKKITDIFPRLASSSFFEQQLLAMQKNETLVEEHFDAQRNIWFETSSYPSRQGLFVYFRDITERKKQEAFLSLERKVLEINAQDSTLTVTVDYFLEGLEKIFSGMKCSVLTLEPDGETIRHLSAPNLPQHYIRAVDGLKIGPSTGSCGTAMYRKENVIVADINDSSLWKEYLPLIQPLGLRSCWSFPILDNNNKVLATIAAYFDLPRKPSAAETETFERVSNLLRIIIENKRAETIIKQTNERYLLATMATNDAIWDWDVANDNLYWGEGFYNLFGYKAGNFGNRLSSWEAQIHPQDRERVINGIKTFFDMKRALVWEDEYRFRKADGKYVLVYDRGFLIFNQQGEISRMVGSMQDITQKKEMEKKLLKQELNRQKLVAQAVVEAQEKERATIGKELHDNVNQILSTAKLYLELAGSDDRERLSLINMSAANIHDAINEIRSISRSLVPSSIDDLGMVDAIRDLVESIKATKKLHIEFYHRGDIDDVLSDQQKLMIFRITQEQVNNVLKHANASQLIIELMLEDNVINLTISDNGQGFDYDKMKTKKGVGLSNIISRAELFNGKVNMVTAPGKGCALNVTVPISNL